MRTTRPVGPTARVLTVLSALLAVLGGVLAASPAQAASPVKAVRLKALSVATAQIGDPYEWGKQGPDAFDCSGLTSFAYAQAGRTLPRTSAAQVSATKRIPVERAKKGDFVFFHKKKSGRVYHVGLYAGNGYVLHAPGKGQQVGLAKIWTPHVFYGRLLRSVR